MIKKNIKVCIISMAVVSSLNATDITTLLDGVIKQPDFKIQELLDQRSQLAVDKINDKLMPSLNGFVGYDRYNRASGMRPVIPSEMKNPHATLPFSKGITRAGANLSFPLFVKSLYTLKKKASLMHLASKDMIRLTKIQKEATVVGLSAKLNYLYDLLDALRAKKRSILSTRKKMAIMVKSGRSAESKLIKIDAKVNDLKMKILELQTQKNSLISKLQNLTGIEVNSRVSIIGRNKISEGEIFALKPLNAKLKASKLGLKAAKESYYPTIGLKGNYTYSSGDAINNDKDVDTDFADLGVFLNLPIYDASKGTKLQEAKLDYIQDKLKIEDTKQNLLIKAKELKKEISYLEHMLVLSQKNIKNQKRLLHIAKVSLLQGVFTEDEYLRYEDALADAKASYSDQRAKMWQDKAQLAVIYGNDLKEIVQ
jgi:outer membrane protein TolC